ncbi:MAG: hypothetical protein NZ700_06990, partial [Gemmataceae bacterium]|nr:hypothetical protein [Gemmataceae bacterium]MDW8265178.1 hypothetical protein [Gemmataceae bacterium]
MRRVTFFLTSVSATLALLAFTPDISARRIPPIKPIRPQGVPNPSKAKGIASKSDPEQPQYDILITFGETIYPIGKVAGSASLTLPSDQVGFKS